MSTKIDHFLVESIRDLARSLRLSNLKNNIDDLAVRAETSGLKPIDFLFEVLQAESRCRKNTAKNRRIREACFPQIKTLEEFDTAFLPGFNTEALERLTRLDWIDKAFNLIFTGPPGVGKTHLASGLALRAAEEGYTVSFVAMPELLRILKNRTIDDRCKRRYNKIMTSKVLLIDGVDSFPAGSREIELFLQMLSQLYEKSSIIITSCSGLEQWPDLLGRNDLVMAVLDRLLHRCEVIHLEGQSYRMQHRESILGQT